MALGKQAKILSKKQTAAVLAALEDTRSPIRNKVIFLLSVKAGLRAKEIASLTWNMVTNSEGTLGDEIHLQNSATKGNSGRIIPLNSELKKHLCELKNSQHRSQFVITSERSSQVNAQTIVNMFAYWYKSLGMSGCSSHSGRRTFITQAARKISEVGGSIRDVQQLAGHSNLSMTQRYIDYSNEAQTRIVELI